jgi:hypothetical protein
MVTDVPTVPDGGFRIVMIGGGKFTRNISGLLETPLTVTRTAPVVAPVGTGATI